jgi:O-antigen ligase
MRIIASDTNRKDILIVFFGIFVFFLPFSQALTINLFFPLKLSEIFLFLLVFIYIFKPKIILNFINDKLLFYLLLLFIFSFLSWGINIFKSFNYELNLSNLRISKNVDGFLKLLYLVIAIFCFIFTKIGVSKYPKKYIKYLMLGAIVSACYSWYLFFSSLIKIPYLKLPGMEEDPQTIDLSFGSIIRCGTALEGNFYGLFLLLAGIIAIQMKRFKSGIFLFFTILSTISTTAIFCTLVFACLSILNNKKISRKIILVYIFIFISTLTIIFSVSLDLRKIVFNKIIGTEDTVDDRNDVFSKLDRLNSFNVGLAVFKENPLFGVGPSNYSLHYDHFNRLDFLEFDDFKRISNNIYIEIACEYGIFAFLTFLMFVILLFKKTKEKNLTYLRMGLFSALIYFCAFPTFTFLIIWHFFGVIAGLENTLKT